MQNKTLRLQIGEKGRRKSLDFGWDKVSRRVMDYYTRILITRTVKP